MRVFALGSVLLWLAAGCSDAGQAVGPLSDTTTAGDDGATMPTTLTSSTTAASTGATAAEGTADDGTTADATTDALATDDGASTSTGAASTTMNTDTGMTSDGSSSSTGEPADACNDPPPIPGDCDPSCDACEDGVCVFDCVGEQVCSGSIECPGTEPCRVDCIGVQPCQQVDVICAGDHPCEIVCSGTQACQQMNVTCAEGPCSMECGPDGENQVCNQVNFDCGGSDSVVTCTDQQDAGPFLDDPGNACACESVGC